MPRKRGASAEVDAPDFVDAAGGVSALWNDFGLWFRASVSVRSDHILMRGYAQDEHTLSESRNWFQTYIRLPLKGDYSLARAIWSMTVDLYAQADKAKAFGQWRGAEEEQIL